MSDPEQAGSQVEEASPAVFENTNTSEPAKSNSYQAGSNAGGGAEHGDGDQFSSRWAYWLAAIGCSVGFGNVWRFPYMVFDYGGAAFFIPYISMLCLVVAPLSVLEFGIGQMNQCGLVTAFNATHFRSRGAGWGFMISFQVLQYYPILLCWSLIYMVNSAKSDLPWVNSQDIVDLCEAVRDKAICNGSAACTWHEVKNSCVADSTYSADFFFHDSCNVQRIHTEGVTKFSWQVLLAWLFTWGSAYAGLAGGAKILGYMTYVTMTMPAVFLLVLVIFGSLQEGADDGIKEYIGKMDFSTLSGDVWPSALAQAIFSMGAMQGSMCGYAAHNRKDQNFVQDVVVVICGDTFFAFLAGFAVFAIAGHLAHLNGVPLAEMDGLAGTALVFQTYPVGLSSIGSPGAQILSFLFFLTLFLLGFSTVVGLSEAVILPVMDSQMVSGLSFLQDKKRFKVAGIIMGIWAAFGFIYATDMGKHFMDCLDLWSAEFSTILFAYLFGLSTWVLGHEECREKVGDKAFFVFAGVFHGSCWFCSILKTIVAKALDGNANRSLGDPAILGIAAGILIILLIVAFVVPLYLVKDQNMPMKERAYVLYIEQPEKLRKLFNDTSCKDRVVWKVPLTWTILMKFLIPVVASFVWIKGIASGVLTAGAEEITLNTGLVRQVPNYDWYVFLVGGIFPVMIDILAVAGFIVPKYMEFILPPRENRPRMDLSDGSTTQASKGGDSPDTETGDEEETS